MLLIYNKTITFQLNALKINSLFDFPYVNCALSMYWLMLEQREFGIS